MIGIRHDTDNPAYMEAGEYGLYKNDWWCRLPDGSLVHLTLWKVIEHEDLSITVKGHIKVLPDGWHGFLTHGVWKKA